MLRMQKKKTYPKQFAKDKDYRKVIDHCYFTGEYRGASHAVCNLRFNVPNKISIVFQKGWNCDYDFIIKELANEFDERFDCLVVFFFLEYENAKDNLIRYECNKDILQ